MREYAEQGSELWFVVLCADPNGAAIPQLDDLLNGVRYFAAPEFSVGGRGRRQEILVRIETLDPCDFLNELTAAFSPFRVRAAAACVTGSSLHLQDAIERAWAIDEVLWHPENSVEMGLVDLPTQGLRSCSSSGKNLHERLVGLLEAGGSDGLGYLAFEGFETTHDRIDWVARILESCVRLRASSPAIARVLSVARDESRWPEAKLAFEETRRELLTVDFEVRPIDYRILGLAELCAKVTYNDSLSPMPFDRDSGWFILPSVISIAKELAGGEDLRKAALSFKAG